MATFPSITPTYGIQKRNAPNFRSVRYGDGFESYNLTFEVSETDADTIETFLDARAANSMESFDFTPPGEGSSSKFICPEWSKSIPYLNRATIQATFIEKFEP